MSAAAAAAPETTVSAATPAIQHVTLDHAMFKGQPMITLVSNDGVKFDLPKNAAEQSGTIKDLLSMAPETEITLAQVEAVHLALIVKWAIYHTVHPVPPVPEHQKHETHIEGWDKEFITPHMHDHEITFGMMRAANWLNMDPLLRLYCKNAANLVKASTPEKLRTDFAVPPGAPSQRFLPGKQTAASAAEPAASAAEPAASAAEPAVSAAI